MGNFESKHVIGSSLPYTYIIIVVANHPDMYRDGHEYIYTHAFNNVATYMHTYVVITA